MKLVTSGCLGVGEWGVEGECLPKRFPLGPGWCFDGGASGSSRTSEFDHFFVHLLTFIARSISIEGVLPGASYSVPGLGERRVSVSYLMEMKGSFLVHMVGSPYVTLSE